MVSNVSVQDLEKITQLLGREPRGLEAVQVRDSNGEPSVIRVCSMVEGKPFPTMFWLIDNKLNYWLDGLEARGVIKQLQQEVDQSESLQQQLRQDHLAYVEMRKTYMSELVKNTLKRLNYYDQLVVRGIGGIANYTRIRCLHTYYAAHLVKKNTVGAMLDTLEL